MIDLIKDAIQSQAVHTVEVTGYATAAIALFEHYTGLGPKRLTGRWQLVPALLLTIGGLFAFALDGGLALWLAALVAIVNGSVAGYSANLLHRGAQMIGGKSRRFSGPPTLRTGAGLCILLVLGLVGCAGSFEEARLAGMDPQVRAAAAPPSEHCQELDARHRTWGAIAATGAVFTGLEGGGQFVTKTDTQRNVLAGAVLGTAAITAGALYLENDYTTTWARECQ